MSLECQLTSKGSFIERGSTSARDGLDLAAMHQTLLYAELHVTTGALSTVTDTLTFTGEVRQEDSESRAHMWLVQWITM